MLEVASNLSQAPANFENPKWHAQLSLRVPLFCGLAHDVGVQLHNKNSLALDLLLFLIILKANGC